MADSPVGRPPRIAPGTRREIGALNTVLTRVLGLATGGRPPNVFTTLARHRRMFRPWLRFAGTLMPRGTLPRKETELLVLRTAWLCDCAYERTHHEALGRRAGLTAEQLARVADGPDADGWSAREAALLRAADELHHDRTLSDRTWDELEDLLTQTQLIELPMLVGHYTMLAMTLNALRVQPDPPRKGRR